MAYLKFDQFPAICQKCERLQTHKLTPPTIHAHCAWDGDRVDDLACFVLGADTCHGFKEKT